MNSKKVWMGVKTIGAILLILSLVWNAAIAFKSINNNKIHHDKLAMRVESLTARQYEVEKNVTVLHEELKLELKRIDQTLVRIEKILNGKSREEKQNDLETFN